MKRETYRVWILFLPAGLSVLVALIPVFKGGSLNVVLFSVGITWFILGLAIAKKARKGLDDVDPKP